MTQEAHSPGEGVTDETVAPTLPAPVPTLALKQAREMAGLHVAVLATMLKVPVRRLEALEAGRYDELPDATFVRALALSVCRQLKIDPAPILASLPQSATVRLGSDQGSLGTPFQSGSDAAKPGFSGAARPLSFPAVFALLVGVAALALWWWLPGQAERALEQPTVQEPVAAAVEPVSAGAALPGDAVTDAQQQAEPPLRVEPDPAPAVPVESLQPAAGETLRLHANQNAWVEVTNGTGRLLVQRNLQEGETVSLTSPAPFSVVLGRADAMEVSFRGQPVDIAQHARNNVARFEVK